ncbi:MAG TPA: hypothetical protein VF194_04485 [Ferrovibrio sp.]|uniref:hypothetical protein n=1 Tax=Ferrovibrio sp. TaxID=1917215 RepID=UPI002ED16C7C
MTSTSLNTRAELDAFVTTMAQSLNLEGRVLCYPGERLSTEMMLNPNWAVLAIKTGIPLPESETVGIYRVRFLPENRDRPPIVKSRLEVQLGRYINRLEADGFLRGFVRAIHMPGDEVTAPPVPTNVALVVLKPYRNSRPEEASGSIALNPNSSDRNARISESTLLAAREELKSFLKSKGRTLSKKRRVRREPIATKADLDEFVRNLAEATNLKAEVLSYPGEKLAQEYSAHRNCVVLAVRTEIPTEVSPASDRWNVVKALPDHLDNGPPRPAWPVIEPRLGRYFCDLNGGSPNYTSEFRMVHIPFLPKDSEKVDKKYALVVVTEPDGGDPDVWRYPFGRNRPVQTGGEATALS